MRHTQGVALWGGAQFEKQGRFAHNNVKHLEFSPGENYMLTCNFDENDPRAIIFWEVSLRVSGLRWMCE